MESTSLGEFVFGLAVVIAAFYGVYRYIQYRKLNKSPDTGGPSGSPKRNLKKK